VFVKIQEQAKAKIRLPLQLNNIAAVLLPLVAAHNLLRQRFNGTIGDKIKQQEQCADDFYNFNTGL